MKETGYTLNPLVEADGTEVMSIFNHYILHSFAAYREEPVSESVYSEMQKAGGSYPTAAVRNHAGTLVGFGMLRAHKPIVEFSHVAEVLYFLHPDHLRHGLGSMLLDYLENGGKKMGVTSLLANISSRNPVSLGFHQARGFVECGRFVGVGKKHGKFFDTVWMQKMLC